jgi:sigma-B regulation protein RsbU (phosphoserine phosphatase)
MPAKILIVDDEADVELLIRQRFRHEMREGVYDFVFARNGAEALTAVSADPTIDLVVSDINMPVMDGLTLLTRLGEQQDPPATVIVSAYGDMPNIRAAMNRGALDFLTKPIDFQDFEVTVRKTIEQVRARRAAAADRRRLAFLERELQIAADIQRSFLPPALDPDTGPDGFRVHAAMIPALAVAGDFYDHFLIDQGRLGVVVGDVSGKGVPAALFMAVTRTLLRAAGLRGSPPGTCLEEVNTLLLRDSSADLFVTLFYAVLDVAHGELHYANGGHNSPVLIRAAGELEQLPRGGLIVGAFPEAVYRTTSVRLDPGDRLFVYSDGITEAMNPQREQFSADRLRDVLRSCHGLAPKELVDCVIESVRQFTAGAPASDDLTALVVSYHGSPDAGAGREA